MKADGTGCPANARTHDAQIEVPAWHAALARKFDGLVRFGLQNGRGIEEPQNLGASFG